MANKVVERWNKMLEEMWKTDNFRDIHGDNARNWLGAEPGQEGFVKQRGVAKIVALGTINDMSPEGIRLSVERNVGVQLSTAEVESLVRMFEKDYSQLWS